MKHRLLMMIGSLLALHVAWVFAYQEPHIVYKFNVNDGNLVTNTGYDEDYPLYMFDFHGALYPTNLQTAGGLGVSGGTSDQAFNNGANAMGNFSTVGGYADQNANRTSYNNRNAMTIALWFNAYAQMMRNAGLVTKWNGNYGWRLDVNTGTTTKPLRLGIGDGTFAYLYATDNGLESGVNLFPETGSWVFCAVSWDGTTNNNNVIWYKGTKTSPVVPVYTGTLSKTSFGSSSSFLTVGSQCGVQTNRYFYGLLDNVRVWVSSGTNSAVIREDGLEVYRQQDIVPEPGMLLGAGVLALAGLLRRR